MVVNWTEILIDIDGPPVKLIIRAKIMKLDTFEVDLDYPVKFLRCAPLYAPLYSPMGGMGHMFYCVPLFIYPDVCNLLF